MKVAVLGTGMVGQAQAAKLAQLGHDVIIGTHDVDKTKAKDGFADWLAKNKGVKLGSFAQAAAHGELIVEAIKGEAAVDTLKHLSSDLDGKVLVDISNALDFSSGEVQIFTANGPSLGEQIQAALPKTKVVKAFNTMNAAIQVDPKSLAGADHHLFIAGSDQRAKDQVIELAQSYGWQNILDLGDIKAARGMEMLMPFWLSLMKARGNTNFNYKIAT